MALVTTLMTMMLLVVLGSALSLLAGMETRISASYREGSEALYAAEAAVEVALDELRAVPEWAHVLDGRLTSSLMFGVTSEATDLPGWRLYALGNLRDFVRLDGVESTSYVVVWVAPVPTGEPDRLAVLAHAHGLGGVRRTVEVHVARDGPPPGVRRLSWREVR